MAGTFSQLYVQVVFTVKVVRDHIHIFVGLKPSMSVFDLVRDTKNNSSNLINSKKYVKGRFSWQEGFGAFSYGASQLPQVINYIEQQQAHHAKRTFAYEYELLLQHFGIEYNPAYVFTPVDDAS